MCGMTGVLTTTRQIYADDFLSDSFVASMLRGVDSSGIVSIDLPSSTYNLHKLPVNGLFFKDDRVTKSIMMYATAANSLTMCHVRAATVGSVTLSNAHPFEITKENGDILLGTHNGTLTGWKSNSTAKLYNVDSEWALSRIAEDGVDAFKDISGAFAFVWWDGSDNGVLHMARNKERTLYVALLKDGGMAYASEAGMLYWLLERNNMKINGSILSLDPDKHYMFPVDKPEDFTKEDLPKKEISYSGSYQGMYSHNSSSTFLSTVDQVKKIIEEASGKTNVVSLNAHPSEQKLAQEYGWFGERAVFTQLEVNDEGDTVGIAETFSTEFDAIIRGDQTKKFDPEDEWLCTVVGVEEYGQDMVLILSEPYRTIESKFEMEE